MFEDRTHTVGFGYDSIYEDYKVVRLVYQNWNDFFLIVQVYSSNADSWRQFKNLILRKLKFDDTHCIIANVVLYFGNEDDLISFDLHEEVFGLVSLPSFDDVNKGGQIKCHGFSRFRCCFL